MLSVIWRTWVWKNGGKSERWDSLHSARYMEEGEGEFKRNKCVQDLMEWDDLETRDNRGNTALIIRAAIKGDEPAFRLLMEMDANVNARNNTGATALRLRLNSGMTAFSS